MVSESALLARLEESVAREASPKTGRLPSERSLAHSLGVGRAELRKALGVLQDQGRIRRLRIRPSHKPEATILPEVRAGTV